MAIGRGKRLQVMLALAEVKVLDDWRFAKKMPSRASAIRELLRRGLRTDGFAVAPKGQRSKDFGVQKGLPNKERKGKRRQN